MAEPAARALALILVAAVAALAAVATPAPAAEPAAPEVQAPSRAEGGTVARVVTAVRARKRLDRPRPTIPVAPQTEWSQQPTTLLVLASATHGGREWVKLLLPNRPNGSSGWVPRDLVVLSRSEYWVEVSIGRRTVTVYRDGRRLRRFRAVVGKPATPTRTAWPRSTNATASLTRPPSSAPGCWP